MGNSEADCREILNRLYLYLDGEAGGQDCSTIERHLEACAYCFRYAEFERAIKTIVARKCSGESAPQSVADSLRARLRGEHP